MDDQKILYIQLFELCKSYDEGKFDCMTYLENPAFKHPNETHKMLEFLRGAQCPIAHLSTGKWYLWDEPDPLAPAARDLKITNLPPQTKEEPSSEVQVDFEVDTSQFAGLTSTDLDQLVQQDNRRDNCRDQRDDDDSSTSDASMGEHRERLDAVRNRVELQERQQVEIGQRANLPEPPKPPSDLQKENRYCKKNQNQERQRSERSYRQDRHKGSYARGSNEQP